MLTSAVTCSFSPAAWCQRNVHHTHKADEQAELVCGLAVERRNLVLDGLFRDHLSRHRYPGYYAG